MVAPRIITSDQIECAAAALRAGRLVAFATETVYGLGGDATNAVAVAEIFRTKGRPRFNPLISHLADAEAAFELGVFSPLARAVAARFWPGPLTIVVERAPDCPIAWLTSAGLQTIALRVPAHPSARALLRHAGFPVAAPSANRSGRVSPTRAAHVAAEFAGENSDAIAMILDDGPSAIGLESTVIDLSGSVPILLRPGAVTREALADLIGPISGPLSGPLSTPEAGEPRPAPGMMESHYAPDCALRLNATGAQAGEVFLGFGPAPDANSNADAPPAANLSLRGDLVEAAANLFHLLRALDQPGVAGIAVAPIPQDGLGAAINDRLTRAAAPR